MSGFLRGVGTHIRAWLHIAETGRPKLLLLPEAGGGNKGAESSVCG